ncbi:MAG: hypothetical protein KA254_01020 [Rhodoferax sp.]|nr:hypothetical protein [Rhodoferax sp.]
MIQESDFRIQKEFFAHPWSLGLDFVKVYQNPGLAEFHLDRLVQESSCKRWRRGSSYGPTEICRSSAQLTGVGLPIQIGKSMSQLCRATAVTPSRGLLELLDLATLNGRADLVQALGDLLEINMLMQLESVKGAH